MIIWITGQHCSGKTTFARRVIELLQACERNTCWIDGDQWRVMNNNQSYSKPGRLRNLVSAMRAALAIEDEYTVVVCSFVSPYREIRERLKSATDVVEVHCHTKRPMQFPERSTTYEPPLVDYIDVCTDCEHQVYLDAIDKVVELAVAKTQPSDSQNEEYIL